MPRKTITVSVPKPCSENWDAMSPQEKGRHCESCNKTVVDFTGMGDARIASILSEQSNICGRYLNSQLGRPLEIPKALPAWKQYISKAAALAVFFSQFSSKKAAAQTDSIAKPDTLPVAPLPVTFSFFNRISCNIEQPADERYRVHKIVFRSDTFTMQIDSISEAHYEFSLPNDLKQDRYHWELYAADSVFTFDMESFNNGWSLSKNIRFSFDGNGWTYFVPQFEYPPVSMGIWAPDIITSLRHPDTLTVPVFTTIYPGITTGFIGDTSVTLGNLRDPDIADSNNPLKPKLHNKWATYYEDKYKSKFSWKWLLLLPVAIGGYIGFRSLRRKKGAGKDNNSMPV